MSLYREMTLMGQSLCGTLTLLLLIVAIYLLIVFCVSQTGEKKERVLAACLTLCLFLLLQGFVDIYGDFSNGLSYWLGKLPMGVPVLLLLLAAAAEAVMYKGMVRRKKQQLTPAAIKESLDALPDGVCFFLPDGRPILVNKQMNEISSELFGTEILNAKQFLESLERVKEEITAAKSTVLVKTAGEKVWEFSQNLLKMKQEEVCELIACDVTRQYQLSRELKQRYEQLNRVNERLHQFSRDMIYFTAEKELLEAKIRVHDDVGRALLAFRAYLAQEQAKRERKNLLLLWRYVISVMKKETAPAGEWDLLEKTAQSLHIQLNISGELPENVQQKTAILAAIHECLTNTAKHAQGDRLDMVVERKETLLTAQFTNNGKIPKGTIREGGGLKNLRNIVEGAGGGLKIESAPRFLLRIEFVIREESQWQKHGS